MHHPEYTHAELSLNIEAVPSSSGSEQPTITGGVLCSGRGQATRTFCTRSHDMPVKTSCPVITHNYGSLVL